MPQDQCNKRFVIQALFAGPALFFKPHDKIAITLTWAPQVWGRADDISRDLDLVNYERHEAKLKVTVPF